MKLLQLLHQDHELALEALRCEAAAREARRAQAFQILVTCMDERNTFATDAIGEPLGAVEIFSSPGGKVIPETILRIYGQQLEEARTRGKEILLYLIPHCCHADAHAGCAAFQTDERAQEAYFSQLADSLHAHPAFAGVSIVTAFYDTDTHELFPFHGTTLSAKMNAAAERLRREKGEGKEGVKGEWDRQHAGNRCYIGVTPRAWTARRNRAFHLHSGMNSEELLEGIALAIKVMKTHSHVNLHTTPIVIQIDRQQGQASPITMKDAELLARLNASSFLHGIEVSEKGVLIVRTETNPETWEGRVISS